MTIYMVNKDSPSLSSVSVARAKAQFAQLVHQAESGSAVRITRRGRSVAVLVSGAEYERLQRAPASWLATVDELRAEAAAAGMPLFDEAELSSLRDQSERPAPILG